MRKFILAFAAATLLCSTITFAGTKPTHGTVISLKSVECGTKKQSKKESTSLMCQEYTVRTASAEYQVRQPKPGQVDIIQPNTPIDFTLDKDKMKFKANGKKYELQVVATNALPAAN